MLINYEKDDFDRNACFRWVSYNVGLDCSKRWENSFTIPPHTFMNNQLVKIDDSNDGNNDIYQFDEDDSHDLKCRQ